jgi:cobalamin biosynthesis protein CobT
MVAIDKQPIDPHFRQRRERIATAVLAQLVGTEGKFRPEQTAVALEAADALIDALDSEGVS